MHLASELAFIAAGLLGLLAIREALLDFAERKLADEASSYAPHGDVAFISADDLELISRFHSERNS